MKLLEIVVSATVALFLCGCPTTHVRPLATPEKILTQGDYIHPASRIVLPESIGGFPRCTVQRYDVDGLDVSAGYNYTSILHPMVATVYIYPAPGLVSIGSSPETVANARALLTDSEFAKRKQEILSVHPDAKLIDECDTTRTEKGKSYPGKMAVFEFEDVLFGSKTPLRSRLYLFCYIGGKWTVKYRFTHPRTVEVDEEIEEFIQSIRWEDAGV